MEREDILEQVLGLHHLEVRDRRTCKEDEESRGGGGGVAGNARGWDHRMQER